MRFDILFKPIVSAVMLSAAFMSYAYDFIEDGIYYNIVDGGCEVAEAAWFDSYSGDVVIPMVANGYTVVGIGDYAFRDCSGLNTVLMPPTLTYIGARAFTECGLPSIEWPAGVSEISKGTFSGCYNLKSVTFSGRVREIGESAFENCTALTSIELPESVTAIGERAFAGSGLTSIILPYRILTISESTFAGCSDLSSVTFDGDLESVGYGAFKETDLVSVTLPETVVELGARAFEGCSNLETVEILGDNSVSFKYSYESYESDHFYHGPFDNCSNLKTVKLPDGMEDICTGAFYGCSSLQSINMPANLQRIGDYAFEDCVSLPSAEFRSLQDVGSRAFRGCSGLQWVKLPDCMHNVGESAFEDCSSLASINLPDGIENIGFGAFAGSGLKSVKWPESMTEMNSDMFNGCTNLSSVTLGSKLNEISYGAFEGCPNIVEVNSLNPTPPEFWTYGFSGFEDEVYGSAVLRVPVGSRPAYFKADCWINFDNIVETDFGGVDDVAADGVSVTVSGGNIIVGGAGDGAAVEVYNIAGQRVYSGFGTTVGGLERGIYIVSVDGRTFKIAL
ncbi:MAG TPA: leucine-rich repeat domain-containing protein [Candidatus Limisoma gallistercoris]|nr:leucine-rich repeat domain-containing protein [Candidatus Limisoma gallistercoris]